MNTYNAVGEHQIIQEWRKLPHSSGRLNLLEKVSSIFKTQKMAKECHSDPLVDREKSLPDTSLGRHRQTDELVPRLIRRHPCEHSVG